MAVAFDAGSVSTAVTGGAALSWTHTPVGTPTAVVIGVSMGTGTTNQVTALTYGGVACTLLTYFESGTSQAAGGEALYILESGIPTGAQTVSVTYTGTATMIGGAISVTGSSGHNSSLATAGPATVSTSVSATVSGTTIGGLIVAASCFGGGSGSGVFSGTNSVTIRYNLDGNTASAAGNQVGGTVASAGGSQTVGFSNTQSDNWGLIAVELLPAGGGSTTAISLWQPGGKWWRKRHRKHQQVVPANRPAFTHIQDVVSGSWSGSAAKTVSINAKAGDLLVLSTEAFMTGNNPFSLSSITDSAGGSINNWQYTTAQNNQSPPAAGIYDATPNYYAHTTIAYCQLTSAITSVTVTFTASITDAAFINMSEYALNPGTVIIDQSASTAALATGASFAAPALTPTGATDLITTQVNSDTGWTGVGAPYTFITPDNGWAIVSAPGVSQQATFTGASQRHGTACALALMLTSGTINWNGAFTATVTAQDSFAGTKNANGALTATVTAQDSFAGTKTGFGALVAVITAAITAAGKKTGVGNLTAAVTALMSAAGTKTAQGVLTTTATAQAAFSGTKTAFGQLIASITAAMTSTAADIPPGTPLQQSGSRFWRSRFRRTQRPVPPLAPVAGSGAFTATVTTQDTIGGTKTGSGNLTATVTAQDTVGGTKTGFGALIAAVTAAMTAAGKNTEFGHLTAAITAAMSAAGTKTAFGAMSASATAQAVFAGTKTTFGQLVAAVTAFLFPAATPPAVSTILQQFANRQWRKRYRRRQTIVPNPTRTTGGAFLASATAQASFTGTYTGFGTLTAAITAVMSAAGTKSAFGHLTATVTAAMSAAGKKTGFGVLSAAATAQATFNGIRTAKAFATFSATARALFNAINNSIRNPMNYGGNIIRTVFGTTASEVANLYGGTLVPGNYGGGLISANTGGTATLSANTLGGTINPPALGGTLTSTAFGGGAVGWTMQEVDQNFPEFNDLTLNVALTSNGSALNLTGYTVKMLMKPNAGVLDSDGRNIILSSGGGSPAITITNAAGGLCNIAIANADVQDQTHTFYRIDAVDGSGHINTCIFGTITYTPL